MYIELVRQVLEQAVETYAARTGKTVPEVLAQIREHIDKTAREHWKDEPKINYDDPLCRLGYLYRHATANATLFEQVLLGSGEVRQKIREADKGTLRLCSVGGGPGTELLGLAKYLLRRPHALPRKIMFTVMDNIPHWGETWGPLAEAAEGELRTSLAGHGVEPPTIAPMFLPLDVLNSDSYKGYAFQFSNVNIIIFNYLFSENKGRLADAKDAITHLAQVAPGGAVFVVIDRLENNPKFKDEVVALFSSVFGPGIALHTFNGTLDSDEQTSDMGAMLTEVLGVPRVKFFTDGYRDPTVFWFAVVRR
jgi:hypothetical protein